MLGRGYIMLFGSGPLPMKASERAKLCRITMVGAEGVRFEVLQMPGFKNKEKNLTKGFRQRPVRVGSPGMAAQ